MVNHFLRSEYLRLKKQPVIPWLCSSPGGCYTQTEAGKKSPLGCSWPETDTHGEKLLDTGGRKRQHHDDEDISTPAY